MPRKRFLKTVSYRKDERLLETRILEFIGISRGERRVKQLLKKIRMKSCIDVVRIKEYIKRINLSPELEGILDKEVKPSLA